MLSSTSHKSLIVRLIAIMSCLRCMRVSSQKIKFVFRISSQRFVLFLMSQMLEASKSKKILNRACVVWSSFNKVTTIFDDATTRTMRFSKRNLIMTMFWTKILSIFSKSSILRGIAWVEASFYVENSSQTEVRILWVKMSWDELSWVFVSYSQLQKNIKWEKKDFRQHSQFERSILTPRCARTERHRIEWLETSPE